MTDPAIPSESDLLFMSLIFNFQAAALQQMGKMVSPITGKTERDLGAAKQSIDLLEALERKTRGNLSAEEGKAIQEILTNLRLNYVDELQKGDAPVESTMPPNEESGAPEA